MQDTPSGRPNLTGYWPEAVAIVVCVVLLGPLHVVPIVGTALSVAGYAAFRWINGLTQKDDTSDEPQLEEVFGQMTRLRASPRLAPFSDDIGDLISAVNDGLMDERKESQDSSLRALTAETLSEIVRYMKDISALSRTPEAGTPVYQNFRNLLEGATRELGKSYSAISSKDNGALADQIAKSNQALQTLHQQIRNEDE